MTSFMNPNDGCLICILFVGMPPPSSSRIFSLSSLILQVAAMVRSIVWPFKFQLALDGSCGMRTQNGSSSGVDSVAMKAASDRRSAGASGFGGGAVGAVVSGTENCSPGRFVAEGSTFNRLASGSSEVGCVTCITADAGVGAAGGGGRSAAIDGGGISPGNPGPILISGSGFAAAVAPSASPPATPRWDANREILEAISSPCTKFVSCCFSMNRFFSSAHFGSSNWMRMCSGMSAIGIDFPEIGSIMCVRDEDPVICCVDTTFGW
mmetsp:Transcript_7860/g.18347  ORF Transcript_7860/g.18347 Transcript_7860/m.18347 type:complete len:265 (+) Transcript_7860:117-911(+)